METLKTDVIIVGAGPTGLSLAAQLLRYGVSFVIIDKKEGVTNLSKAVVVHARTLEIYDQIGLAKPAVQQGKITQHLALMHDGEVRARLDFNNVGGELSPFPFVLVFEQSKNERLLADHLQKAGLNVRWQTTLESLTQNETGVHAILKDEQGETQTVEARYLVGCDGASSTTRHALGLGFEGSTYPRLFYVADVEMEFEAEEASIYASFGTDSFVLLFPMQGEKHWRLIGNLPEYEPKARTEPENSDPKMDVPYAVIESKAQSLIQRPLDITKVRWFSTYKVHTRHAETFQWGRCFLAGDASHVHTPAGGQGMNTGIQDAYNLAWKLAWVLEKGADDSLLTTYNQERLANAKRLLQTTDQIFEVAANQHWYAQFFRDHILPGLAGFLWRFDAVREFIFPTLSQIGVSYRESALSWHEGDEHFKAKAGDRLPYFQVEGVGIFEQLRAPLFHLLVFSDGPSDSMGSQENIQKQYGDQVDIHLLPLSADVVALFGVQQPFMVLVRPDNYIGLISPTVDEGKIADYLKLNQKTDS